MRRSSTVTYRARAEPGKPPRSFRTGVSSTTPIRFQVKASAPLTRECCAPNGAVPPPVSTTWRGRPDLLGCHICSPKFASIRLCGIGRRMGTVNGVPPTLLKFILNYVTNGGRLSASESVSRRESVICGQGAGLSRGCNSVRSAESRRAPPSRQPAAISLSGHIPVPHFRRCGRDKLLGWSREAGPQMRSGLLWFRDACGSCEFGSGLSKTKRSPLILPGRRERSSNFSAVRSRGWRPSSIAWVMSGAR